MYVIKHNTMKMHEKVEVYLHVLLTSAVDGGPCSLSHLGPIPVG
jgi:hypothetical protein